MKSMILIACLLVSASAEPQKSSGLERESPKSEKLQFTPGDAQVYTGSVGTAANGAVLPQVYGQGANWPRNTAVYTDQVSSYYAGAVVPGVTRYVPGVGVVPYNSAVGQTTVTSTSENGLPTGTVYEHTGSSHIGHLASAVHVKRPGQLYSSSTVYGSPILPGTVANYPNPSLTYYNGQVQYINGQPAQYLNGQWYWVDNTRVPYVNQYAYTQNVQNPLYRPTFYQAGGRLIPGSYVQPGSYVPAVYDVSRVGQPAAVRPAVATTYTQDKWYTKTNSQPVLTPFYGQPQYAQSAAGTKSYVVPKPDLEAEKSDW